MTKETAVEGIKRHLEAILNIAKEAGFDDYLSVGIVDGFVMVNNSYNDTHADDGLGFSLSYRDEEWFDILKGFE